MRKLGRFNQICWAATVVVLAVGLVGNLLFYRQILKEDAEASDRLAAMNAKADAPATRYSVLDAEGVERHTFCSGGGWCVTDTVPPDDFTKTDKKPSTIPVIDVAYIKQILEAQSSKDAANR